MHPVILVLLAWLALDVVLVASALVAGRHRARRPELSIADLLDQGRG